MFEIRVIVEAPDVCAAIRELSAAMVGTAAATKPVVNTTEKQTIVQATQPAAQPVQQFTQPAPNMAAQPSQQPQQAPAQPVQQFTQPAPNTMAQPNQQAVQQQATTEVPTYTVEGLSKAGAALLENGKMPQLIALLNKFGVQSIAFLPPEQYPAFAAELRALGAVI